MFCEIKGKESRGLAKIIASDGTQLTVEYFFGPTDSARETVRINKSLARRTKLGANTRIYYLDDISGLWSVGRVIQDNEDGVEVRFANRNDVILAYDHLFVRCKRPIEDPTEYLANIITETPQYAEGRSEFLASYIRQRGAAWGVSALLSSVIELEPHQISVARRILNDPSQRYLLADEVGLGKTIEAGIVIRQAVLDDPKHHKVVVLAPTVLVHQWREELTIRFGLRDFLEDSVYVISQEESLAEIDSLLLEATMLVVDEAHHIAAETAGHFSSLYDCVRVRAQSIDRLLLLSATPVLRNEVGFLKMLHLLDPVMYPLGNEDVFREKIRHRQILAESVAMLDAQNALYLDEVLDELGNRLPDDQRLGELIERLRSVLALIPEEDDPDLAESLRILRAHISETYRLNRRILRNRRRHVKFVTPDRCGSEQIIVPETRLAAIESLIESWRISANGGDVDNNAYPDCGNSTKFYWELLDALLTDPGRIAVLCRVRLAELTKATANQLESEKQWLEELASLVDQETWIEHRLNHLTTLLPQMLAGRTKVVIFCSLESVADLVYQRLFSMLNKAVVRHSVSSEEGDKDNDDAPAWFGFNRDESVQVIVCDRKAEEGINLQGGSKLVIHFDLPLEPNRIEQRMGRVDRYGAGDAVKSFVVLDETSKYQHYWYTALNSALGVFNRSISSLQYLVESEMKVLVDAIFREGLDALHSLIERLGGADGAVEKELKLIDQQDALDEFAPLTEDELGDVFDVDAEWGAIRRATMGWANDTLLFGEMREGGQPNNNATDQAFRFHYRVPGQGGPATLIPLTGFLDDFMGALDYEDPRSTYRQPLSYPHCARRQGAVRNGYRLIRYGDEFIEALKSFSDLDDRGRSFAIWREVRRGYSEREPKFYFRFDFLVEASLDDAFSVLQHLGIYTETASAAVARRADGLFRPFVERVWVDEDGNEASSQSTEQFLDLAYDKHGAADGYIDTNLKPARFHKLIESAPEAFSNWKERCARLREAALAIVRTRQYLENAKKNALSQGKIEDETREAQLLTRIRTLTGVEAGAERNQLRMEEEISDSLYRGIISPSIKVDVAGVVIVAPFKFPNE